MSETIKAAHAAIKELQAGMQAQLAALAGGDAPPEQLRVTHDARLRMNEAAMLLGLAAGQSFKMHPNVHALSLAIGTADRMGRVLLDGDLDYGDMGPDAIARAVDRMDLAEAAFQHFRINATLAMMHLSDAITTWEQVAKSAQRAPGAEDLA